MAKFIGQTGLVYLWGKIKNYVSNYVKITSSTGKDTITAGNNSIDVYDWAQASTKPSYTANEVGALPSSTTIPSKTSDLTNDSGFITSADVPEGVSPYTSTPAMNGVGNAGSSALYAKGDHVHPSDTSKAPLASPTFTGTPTAPTATAGTNTTQVATTAFVTTAIQNAQTGAAMFQGTASTSFAPTDYKKGYYWIVGTAGTYCGETCEAGDMIYAVADFASSYKASDFNVVQRNLDIAEMSTSEMDTATSNWT